jgi:ectoine hydrolase
MPVFAVEEYARRNAMVQDALSVRGLDGMLCCDPADMNWLTGYDGWSFYVPQGVLVIAGDPVPYWIGRGIDLPGARLTCWMEPERLHAYGDTYVENPPRHAMEFFAQVAHHRGLARGQLGIETDGYSFSPRARDVLAARLPNCTLTPADGLVAWLRIVKSAPELALMREAAQIADTAMAAGVAVIAPGVPEAQAAAAITAAQVVGFEGRAGAYPAEWVTMPSGPRAQAAHLSWADRSYTAGESVNIELAGCRHRYHAAVSRTVSIGAPGDELLRLLDATVEGMEAALSTATAGSTCEAVEAAFGARVARHGFEKASRIGYTLGVGYPPVWGERTASLRPGDCTVLKPGMAFHLMLGMWRDEASCVLSDVFVVRDQGGPEILSRLPRRILVAGEALG